jgi:hypothetical protein
MSSDLNISSGEKLLIELCRLDFTSEHAEKIKVLASAVTDWKYLAKQANEHGMGALLYHNLEKLGILQNIPEEVNEFLKNIMILSLTRNTRHINEMKGILALLNKAGIKTVLLKGMALELTLYGNSGLRQMTDVDVLISREDCIMARKLLLANGFKSLPVKSPFHKLIITYTGKHLPSLIRNGFSIEIHHELFGEGKSLLTKMLSDSSNEILTIGEKAYIPAEQMFFLYLIKHLNYHEMNNESQLRLYTDLVVLIDKNRDGVLNNNLVKLAEQAGLSEVLAHKLELLRDFWGITYPEWINAFVAKFQSIDTAGKFVFFLKSPKNNPPPDRSLPYRNTINEIPGIHRKIIYILGDLFPSFGFMKKRYSCKSSWKALLYYPHRLGKLWYLIKKG